jgi:hypothetical protein
MPPLAVRLREIWSASISVAPHACSLAATVLAAADAARQPQSEW